MGFMIFSGVALLVPFGLYVVALGGYASKGSHEILMDCNCVYTSSILYLTRYCFSFPPYSGHVLESFAYEHFVDYTVGLFGHLDR